MNELADRLRRLIAVVGPLTVERYMAAALGDPEQGYYHCTDPLGAEGDFVTAPEVSQMFGELLGLWCATSWEAMGRPAPFLLAEIGPGRGTLMEDALRALRNLPDFHAALRLHLVESSPKLKAFQAERLKGVDAAWHDTIGEVPEGPMVLIANELFDALPIRQLVRTPEGWCERLVAVDAESGELCFVVATRPSPAQALVPPGLKEAGPGAIFEVSPAAIGLAHHIGRRLAAFGGAALIVDYGGEQSGLGETLQAVKRHRPHPVLAAPGEADLTAHVDFALLAKAAREAGARTYGPVSQGAFLRTLGIDARARRLMARATARQREDIAGALRRLTHPDEMGTLFKAFAITHPDLKAPAGFEVTSEGRAGGAAGT